jgi:PhnB protein
MQVIVPYLTMKNAAAAIDFYKKAFGAKENGRAPAEDGKRLLHVDLSINGGPIYLMDEFPEHSGDGHAVHAPAPDHPSPVSIVVNFDASAEVDAAHRRAVDAGCKSTMEPQDTFWNAHFAMVRDPYGYHWMLSAALPAKT